MKNFKRVISAVIALALSASTLVAVSASKFADVDGTSYAEAIEVLTALDIAHGYDEEGGLVFKPEGEITRAEAATLIVGALNMMNDAKAAAGTSKFTDVNEKASWASGYVNVGVAQGFINGMDDTTFAPQENVTYAQMCVMLTLITGYGDYAKAYGGWPTGYTTMAASAGINKGVAVSNDTPLKRGQVAQMLYNAMTTPLLGVKAYNLNGNDYAIQDGTDLAFKTLLSDKFDGYTVSASVQAIPGDSGYGKGEAQLKLEKSEYTDEVKTNTNGNATKGTTIPVLTDLDLSQYKFQSGNAVITKDANEKWHLVYFAANTMIDTKEYSAADFVDNATVNATANTTNAAADFAAGSDATIKFNNTTVKVPATAKLYVNGVDKGAFGGNVSGVSATGIPITINNYFKEAQGTVKVIKDTNGKIDKVMIDVYLLGKVDGVDYKNATTTVSFASKLTTATTGIAARKIVLSDDAVAENEAEILVTRNGETAQLGDLNVGDVIAIYYAFDANQTITDPKSMKILATDATEEGELTVSDTTDNEFVINGNEYKAVAVADFTGKTVGSTISALLDPFGRIYSIDEAKTADKYALVTYFDGDDTVTLLTEDGQSKSYKVADGDVATIQAVAAETKADIYKRVITYKYRSRTNEIFNVVRKNTSSDYRKSTSSDEYKASTGKLASITLSDSTYIVNATKVSDSGTTYKKLSDLGSYSELKDGINYEAYAWDKSSSSNVFGFVIVTIEGSTISTDSRFAVAKKITTALVLDKSEEGFAITALYDGQEQVLEVAADARVYKQNAAGTAWVHESATKPGVAIATSSLAAGEAFFFTTDSEGLIDAIYVVGADFTTVAANENTVKALTWDDTLKNASHWDVQLVQGKLITAVNSSNVQFAYTSTAPTTGEYASGGRLAALAGKLIIDKNISDDAADSKGVYDYPIASDCVVYTRDLDGTYNNALDKYYEGGSVKASKFDRFQFKEDSSYIWCKSSTATGSKDPAINDLTDSDNYDVEKVTATALIVDGVIVEIYQTIY